MVAVRVEVVISYGDDSDIEMHWWIIKQTGVKWLTSFATATRHGKN